MYASEITEYVWEEIIRRWCVGESQEALSLDYDVCQSEISVGIRKRVQNAQKVRREMWLCPNCCLKIPAFSVYCLHCGQEVESFE